MAALEVPAEIDAVIARDRARLARPGTWLTGPARVGLASVARGEREPVTPAERAAHGIHDHPATLTREWLAGLEAEGLTLV